MSEKDVAAVHRVEVAAYEHPWTENIFRDCLRVGYCCWVLELEHRPMGHAVMSVAAGEAHLLNICLHPDQQRRGHGRELLRQMCDLAREHGAHTLFLEVRVTNHVARRLYQDEGFNQIGERRDYYPATVGREDAILYAREL